MPAHTSAITVATVSHTLEFHVSLKSKCLLTFELKINVQNLSTERIFQDFLVIFIQSMKKLYEDMELYLIQSMKKTRDQEGLPHTVWQK